MRYFGGGGGGQGGCIMEMSQLKIMPIISCFIRLTGLFLFMALEVTVNYQLKMRSQQPPLCGSCSVISGLPHKTVHHFQNLFCSSPSPHPVQSWNSEKFLDTCIQLCLGGEGRGWACVNWKTPQKCKSIPRLMSVIVWKRGGTKKVNFQWFSSL